MAMICAISQLVPEEPVVSPLSGCVFEKRLIKKYISEYKKDPISNEPLEENQLIDLKSFSDVVKPKLPNILSIPDYLKRLKDEWDSTMLDSYELKQHLQTTRQELSHALYQLDASYRVIARLKAENDELRSKLREQDEEDVE